MKQNDFYISIHAPAKGATPNNPSIWVLNFDFNPRSREGSDTLTPQYTGISALFQSTLPRRERLKMAFQAVF